MVAEGLGAIQAAHPEVSIGSYPYFRPGHYGASLVVRGTDPVLVAAVAAEVSELVRALGGHSAVVDAMAAVPDAMA